MAKQSLLDIGEFAAYLLDYDGKVAYFVLVDPQCGETWYVGEFDMCAVVVAIQDESAQLIQLPQKSWAPLMAELRAIAYEKMHDTRQNVMRG